ncbi:transposase (plasmid) [Methylocystis sp. MJC1]|uniref:transposase n=1 Tax=Methylocystis sp. MJC1 TaxID=2654282 RepID=UPI001FED91A4|nr:transposase [Methylocystis sp. MJC1]UZX14080.1 transposase [Methylocystis sp. MJC1]
MRSSQTDARFFHLAIVFWSRSRGSLTIWFTPEAIAGWKAQPRTTLGGQRHYPDLAIEIALILRTVFRVALRQS